MGNEIDSLRSFTLKKKYSLRFYARSFVYVCARVCNIKESVCRTNYGNFETRFTYVADCTHKKIECTSGTPGITCDMHVSFVFPLRSFYDGHLKFVQRFVSYEDLLCNENTFMNVVNSSSFNCGSDNDRYLWVYWNEHLANVSCCKNNIQCTHGKLFFIFIIWIEFISILHSFRH